jgi:hypothetical protein
MVGLCGVCLSYLGGISSRPRLRMGQVEGQKLESCQRSGRVGVREERAAWEQVS